MTTTVQVLPADVYNRQLVQNAHPPDWLNPKPAPRYHMVVIGAGTAGLITASGAAGLGAKVALIERELMGGDCLNFGCVPSKALIRASRACAQVRDAGQFGVELPAGARVNFPAVMERMRRLRAAISQNDSAQRYRGLGIDVFLGSARFSGPDTVEVAGKKLRFRRAVLGTGTRAARPPIPGLAQAEFLTNETVFSLTELPARLAVIGAGPIGCELAQVFARFGAKVYLLANHAQILPREDQDAAEWVEASMRRDGVHLVMNCHVVQVERRGAGKRLTIERNGERDGLEVDQILVGAGRAPNVEGLNLEAAGVSYDARHGVKVNDRLQTTNPRIYAAGDICSRFQFTHAADAMARIVIQNALLLGRAKASALTIPWCTYTDPEIAHVGLYEHQARARGLPVATFVQKFEQVDRAILDGDEEGFVKVHLRQGTDQILGATIVGRHAGEMISELTLAIVGRLGLRTIARTLHPYPTHAEGIKRIADAYNRTRLTPRVKALLQKWFAWTR